MISSHMILIQAGLALLIFVCTLFFTIIPSKFMLLNQSWLQTFISLANCFSAGIFIGTCNLQMIPMLEDEISKIAVFAESNRKSFYVQVIVITGFFVVLFTEVFARRFKINSQENSKKAGDKQYHRIDENDENTPINRNHEWPSSQTDGGLTLCEHEHHVDNVEDKDEGHGHSHLIDDMGDGDLSFRTILLIVALGIHSVFEGLAIGLQSEIKPLINLYLGVIIHEIFVALAMGINLCKHDFTRTNIVKLAVTLSLMIPIGTLLGIIINVMPKTTTIQIVSVTMQGIAAGTFVYVVFIEILPAEIQDLTNHLWKSISILLGVVCMSLLAYYLH